MSEIEKCRTCKHYDSFFGSCNLYVKDVYLGEGEWDERPVRIKEIEEDECEYEKQQVKGILEVE